MLAASTRRGFLATIDNVGVRQNLAFGADHDTEAAQNLYGWSHGDTTNEHRQGDQRRQW
jgi:hypothetical protein